MKKILIVIDCKNWAIDKLSQAIIKNNSHFDFRCYYLHPRDVVQKINEFKKFVDDFYPDIIHFQYYRSCSQALELCPELKKYKIIITHHNQRTKAINEKQWEKIGVNKLVCHTQKCKNLLLMNGDKNISVIQHGIDLDYFTYSDKEPKEKRIGYVGRIVPWKGLYEICKVAKELNYKVIVMGRVDKPDYLEKVKEFEEVIDYSFYDCEDKDRIEAYRNMTIYVGNSIDGYEEGTLPYIEAMACGVPVATTLNGEAKDLAIDNKNALVVPFKDEIGSYEKLKEVIAELMENKELRQKLRKGGYEIARLMNEKKMAKEYSKVYHQVYDERPLVSVIIPALEKDEFQVLKIIESLNKQTYKNLEIIIVWDEIKKDFLGTYSSIYLIKNLWTNKEGYNLAMARNMGAIEAEGDYIMFNDVRLCPESNAIEEFIKASGVNSDNAVWFFGDKGSHKKSFVENFSFVERDEFINFGMMNERMDIYGGLSQEIRTRWQRQGKIFMFVENAKSTELKSSHMTDERRKDIIESKLKLFKMYG